MRTRIIRCAECRMEHFAPIDGAAGFPTNITLINFLDLQAQPGGYMMWIEVANTDTLVDIIYIWRNHVKTGKWGSVFRYNRWGILGSSK